MERISELILKKITSTLSAEEAGELEAWIGDNAARRNLVDRLSDPKALDEEYAGELRINPLRPAEDMQLRIDRMRRLSLRRRMMKAAALLAVPLLGAALWMLMPDTSLNNDMENPATIASRPLTIEDITPGSVGAVYTTPNGEAITLNASDTSIIANKLIANADRCTANRTADNLSLEVGRGREFKIIL